MTQSNQQLWQRFQKYYREYPTLGLALDLSRMNFGDEFLRNITSKLDAAFTEMAALENGAVANKDEKRMVGHYWLRNASLAPTPELKAAITSTVEAIKAFTAQIHTGAIQGPRGPFKNLLVIGIGGSALGPQFVANALGNPATDKMRVFFFDNTDPDGIDKVLASIGNDLERTLCLVISKSGGTKETRNGMLEAEAAFRRVGLDFGAHTVAITGEGSELDKYAYSKGWLKRFPMWDWVGGRTSVTSSVGLLPAALQGFDIDNLLKGAAACDQVTRQPGLDTNPAGLMAAVWHYVGNGRGDKAMVVLPYKDRLELFSKYLQQLVMESLGKELDRGNQVVNTGLTVYGNKGSTDQHAYIQQLRDGLANFFVTFIEVLQDRKSASIEVDPQVTSGDYLSGFFLGTRKALYESGRESITLTIGTVSAFSIGVLIALFERAVGLYASLININAYHQPGVEAGKKAAGEVIQCQRAVLGFLAKHRGKVFHVEQIAEGSGFGMDPESVFKICEHLSANERGVKKTPSQNPFAATYQAM